MFFSNLLLKQEKLLLEREFKKQVSLFFSFYKKSPNFFVTNGIHWIEKAVKSGSQKNVYQLAEDFTVLVEQRLKKVIDCIHYSGLRRLESQSNTINLTRWQVELRKFALKRLCTHWLTTQNELLQLQSVELKKEVRKRFPVVGNGGFSKQ